MARTTGVGFAGRMDRRGAITLLGAGAFLAACAGKGSTAVRGPKPQKIVYGSDASQFGELTRPQGTPRGVAVVIHGGFWHEHYDLSLGRATSADLAKRGWIAWNLEYRRIENGGGWPTTFDDIAAGIDKLADIPDVPTDTVVTIGHSAGGHLAVWAGARPSFTDRWADPKVPITAAISQAGVLDLKAAVKDNLGGGAAQEFMRGRVDGRYALADPTEQIPLTVPVWCVHGDQDGNVPISQSADYVKRATDAGANAELIRVKGDHFVLIDPSTQAWARIVGVLDSL